MKKITIQLLLVLALTLAMLTGCSNPKENPSDGGAFAGELDLTGFSPEESIEMGVTIMLPDGMIKNGTLLLGEYRILFGDIQAEPVVTETTPEREEDCFFLWEEGEYILFGLRRFPADKWDAWMKEGKQPSDITGITETEEIGRKDGLVYLFTKPEDDVSALTKEQQDLYQTLRDLLPTIRSSIAFTTSGETNLPAFPEFSVVDLNGNTVDNSVFSGYQLTMVNMWGTFCVPCIEEMPMLEEISQSFPEDVQLIGILVDVYDNDTTYADQIIADTGVSYPNLIADGALRTYLEENIIAYPTTLFVDSNGNIVGDAVVGEREADVYLTVLQDRLDLLNG